ncbi:hypothetical protein ACFX15_021498 [Malus domestica]
MPASSLGTPAFELGHRASAWRPKQQHGTAIRRRHPPQLSPEALVIRIALAAALPRQPIDIFRPGLDTLLRLQLQIEFHGLLQALTSGPIALPGSNAAAELDYEQRGGEEGDEADDVGDGNVMEVDGEGGVREEEREGVEDVGKVRGDEEGPGEEDEDEDEEVEGGRRRVLAEEGAIRV